MKYILITQSGRQYLYHIKGCAEIYQLVYGGQIHVVDHRGNQV